MRSLHSPWTVVWISQTLVRIKHTLMKNRRWEARALRLNFDVSSSHKPTAWRLDSSPLMIAARSPLGYKNLEIKILTNSNVWIYCPYESTNFRHKTRIFYRHNNIKNTSVRENIAINDVINYEIQVTSDLVNYWGNCTILSPSKINHVLIKTLTSRNINAKKVICIIQYSERKLLSKWIQLSRKSKKHKLLKEQTLLHKFFEICFASKARIRQI